MPAPGRVWRGFKGQSWEVFRLESTLLALASPNGDNGVAVRHKRPAQHPGLNSPGELAACLLEVNGRCRKWLRRIPGSSE